MDKNTSFKGSITASEVIVEGTIKGNIIASDKVLIKNGGVISGNITTKKILFEEGGKHNGLIRLGPSIEEDTALESPPQISQIISDDEQEEQIEEPSETVEK